MRTRAEVHSDLECVRPRHLELAAVHGHDVVHDMLDVCFIPDEIAELRYDLLLDRNEVEPLVER